MHLFLSFYLSLILSSSMQPFLGHIPLVSFLAEFFGVLCVFLAALIWTYLVLSAHCVALAWAPGFPREGFTLARMP